MGGISPSDFGDYPPLYICGKDLTHSKKIHNITHK